MYFGFFLCFVIFVVYLHVIIFFFYLSFHTAYDSELLFEFYIINYKKPNFCDLYKDNFKIYQAVSEIIKDLPTNVRIFIVTHYCDLPKVIRYVQSNDTIPIDILDQLYPELHLDEELSLYEQEQERLCNEQEQERLRKKQEHKRLEFEKNKKKALISQLTDQDRNKIKTKQLIRPTQIAQTTQIAQITQTTTTTSITTSDVESINTSVKTAKKMDKKIQLDDFANQYNRFLLNLQVHDDPPESTYEQFGNFLHHKIVCHLEKELNLNLFEFFRVTVDNSDCFLASKNPDYSMCMKCCDTFLPLFVSEFKNNAEDQVLYSSPLPSPYLNFCKIYSTVVGTKATVCIRDEFRPLKDVKWVDAKFDLKKAEDAITYIYHIVSLIKQNYNKEQQVETILGQKKSYTIVCRDYVYKMCVFDSVDVASCNLLFIYTNKAKKKKN